MNRRIDGWIVNWKKLTDSGLFCLLTKVSKWAGGYLLPIVTEHS